MKKWSEVKSKKLTAAQIAESEEWARGESLAMDLRQLREWAGLTQAELADTIDVSQAELSRAERRGDHLLSTLRRYVEALGGELEVRATLNNKSITLKV